MYFVFFHSSLLKTLKVVGRGVRPLLQVRGGLPGPTAHPDTTDPAGGLPGVRLLISCALPPRAPPNTPPRPPTKSSLDL